jgi:hypothetical protein
MNTDLSGDKALVDTAGDRLGFAATANAIAATLVRQHVVDGLVIGIEGRWGSGKSSLVNMTVNALRSVEIDSAPEIIEFKPWLIGDRNGLLLALFTELAIAVDTIEEGAGDAVGRRRRELGDAGKKIVGFAAQLGGLGTLAKVAGTVFPGVSLAGDAIEALAKAAKGWDGQRSLASEKAELRERLTLLPRRIVVTIDDVDRLEPSEVVEILRLVRSVADFPNVIYMLCYDPRIVAQSIQAAAQVEDGRAYIEKIVQIAVSVPRPEAFDLRRWFGEEIDALPHGSNEAGAWRSQLSAVIDIEGGRYLSTPRHVVRCLDSIRFFWGALQDQVDLGDLVWLNLVKVGNPKLYEWIERYLPETAARASGVAIIGAEERRASRKELDKALLAEDAKFKRARHRLSEFLPGIDEGMNYGNEKEPGVHADLPKEEVARAARFRRLASPDHYRLYFAIQQPRNSPRKEDFEELLAALDDSIAVTSELLANWNGERLSSGATKAEAMLSRIVDADKETFVSQRAQVLLCAMADRLDEMGGVRQEGIGDPQSWVEGRRVLRWLLPILDHRREETLLQMFRGRALDWLTTILRSETFAHGRVGGARSGEKLLQTDELDRVSVIMVDRYRNLRLAEWTALRRPLSALFAWYQAGDQAGPKHLVASEAVTDEGLVSVLELMGGRVSSSSHGEYIALKEETLRYFMNYAEARSRIEKLARDASDFALRSRALTLMQQFKDADA